MARPELGTKRTCPTTGRKFYDLNRDPIVSPYTGDEIPRTAFDPPTRATAAPRGRVAVVDEDEAEVVPAGPEIVSLEDVEAGEEAKAGADDDTVAEDEGAADDTFLEEEEGSDDVVGLIDGDIEEEEEG